MWPFKKKQVKLTPEILAAAQHYLQTNQPANTYDGYYVGFVDGATVVKVKGGNAELSIVMTPDEVYRFIRLLNASLNRDPEEPVNDQL